MLKCRQTHLFFFSPSGNKGWNQQRLETQAPSYTNTLAVWQWSKEIGKKEEGRKPDRHTICQSRIENNSFSLLQYMLQFQQRPTLAREKSWALISRLHKAPLSFHLSKIRWDSHNTPTHPYFAFHKQWCVQAPLKKHTGINLQRGIWLPALFPKGLHNTVQIIPEQKNLLILRFWGMGGGGVIVCHV